MNKKIVLLSIFFYSAHIGGDRGAIGQGPFLSPLIDVTKPSKSPTKIPKSCSINKVEQFKNGVFKHTRIIGGIKVRPDQMDLLPWQVDLSFFDFHICGGTIIHKSYILTAAHCSYVFDSDLVARAGIRDINRKDEPTEQRRKVVQIFSHPGFNMRSLENDISLLYVYPPFDFSSKAVKPIRLPKKSVEFSGCCAISGWGRLTYPLGDSHTNILQITTVPTINKKTCEQQTQALDPSTVFKNESMMCAGYLEGGRDACQGDSGGPLMCVKGNKLYLAGCISWGIDCAYQESPGVYTQVSYFIDWIKEVINTPRKPPAITTTTPFPALGALPQFPQLPPVKGTIQLPPKGSPKPSKDSNPTAEAKPQIVQFTFVVPDNGTESAAITQELVREEFFQSNVKWYSGYVRSSFSWIKETDGTKGSNEVWTSKRKIKESSSSEESLQSMEDSWED